MPTSWMEYLESRKRLVDIQNQAMSQPTPATRLAFYLSATYSCWRVQSDVIRKLDEAFEVNDYDKLYEMESVTPNGLISAIARELRGEAAMRQAVENNIIKPEDYTEAWWVKN